MKKLIVRVFIGFFFCLGVLSIFINFRDGIDYYLKYTRSIDDYVKENEKENIRMTTRLQNELNNINVNLFALDSIKKVNEELRKKMKQDKLDFRNELSIDIYGFKKDLMLVRDEANHMEIQIQNTWKKYFSILFGNSEPMEWMAFVGMSQSRF